jgi:hypothetical protein
LSQASICGSALALIPAVRNVRTIRSSRGVVRPSGSPIGIGTRRVMKAGRAVADHVAVHRAAGRGEAEQHPLVADHRAQRLRAGRPVEQEQHVAFEAGE